MQVSKVYDQTAVLADVTLTIGRGEFFCLLGPSGCGKTTLMNIIGGFADPSDGEVLIDGHSVVDIPPYRRPVNTVFQNYALFPHMTVFDNVAFGLRMTKVPEPDVRRRVDEGLELVNLREFGRRLGSQLSGGQQQRVALARALVNQPTVLLLDEPLGALDLKLRKQMQRELARIHRQVGMTFVFVTHDQEEAMSMADRIAVMDKGRVVQVGTPEEIYNQPSCHFVADFIGEANLIPVRQGTALPCRSLQPASPGEGVVMVRPENISIRPEVGVQDPGPLVGTVTDITFLGQSTRVYVQTDIGYAVVAACFNGGAAGAAEVMVGQRVSVTWAPDFGILLTK